jgi:hypothetical protein
MTLLTDPTTGIDIERARAVALLLLEHATNGDAGRSESDPVYVEVTEKRDFGAKYSSCGDLCHWLHFRLGVRSDYLNRAEHKGWRVAQNISRLAWRCPAARPPKAGERFSAGDVLIVFNQKNGLDAHALVVRDHTGDEVHSADYGQPGGARKTRKLNVDPRGALVLGGRRVQFVLPLFDVLTGAARRGELAPVDIPPDAERALPDAAQGVA